MASSTRQSVSSARSAARLGSPRLEMTHRGSEESSARRTNVTPRLRVKERLKKLSQSTNKVVGRKEYEILLKQVRAEVDAFAKKRPLFDEIAHDIHRFVNSGFDLVAAYDSAIALRAIKMIDRALEK
jgi:hypothetical protein